MRSEQHGVPISILARYRKVTLCADIMFVNKIPFFVTISRNIKFGTIEVLKNRKHPTILKAFKNVSALYKTRGVLLNMAHTDTQFEPMQVY
mgnify:FL=1